MTSTIPVRITPYFWLLAALIGWINSSSLLGTVIWVGVILVSVLIHEYGHALTARLFGQDPVIELVGMGGVTHRNGPRLKLWQEFLVVFNGPLAGLLLCIAAAILEVYLHPDPHSVWGYTLAITVLANFFWTVINLLPIYPLDGGHLLKIILEGMFGLKGIRMALLVSIIVGGALAFFFFVFQYFLTGAILLMLTFESWRAWQQAREISDVDRSEPLQELLREAENAYKAGRKEEAIELLEKIRHAAPAGVINYTASTFLAHLVYQQGEFKRAYDLLMPIRNKLTYESSVLLHQLAYRHGDLDTAIEIGNRLFQESPIYETALLNAFCYAQKGESRPSLGWLQSAIRSGLPNIKQVLHRKELEPLQHDSQFQELLQKYST